MRAVRFAPSPTGAFHVGNFRTAWISREWARILGQPWVLRSEDIDGPRAVPGARERQAAEMARLGLVADESSIQSERHWRHLETFERARAEGQVYPCTCSRATVRAAIDGLASAPHEPVAIYDGRCRARADAGLGPEDTGVPNWGWRFKMPGDGRRDFIIARTESGGVTEFVPAYAWACAVDDLDGGYLLLVRAWDLLHALEQQRAIQGWLDPAAALPAVFHTALVTMSDGSRLEKRTRGLTLPELEAAGVTPEALVKRFAASFSARAEDFAPSAVFGEDRHAITLAELGL